MGPVFPRCSGVARVSATPPTVAQPAAANPNPVAGTTTNLSVLGADDGGESALTYTWESLGTTPSGVLKSLRVSVKRCVL